MDIKYRVDTGEVIGISSSVIIEISGNEAVWTTNDPIEIARLNEMVDSNVILKYDPIQNKIIDDILNFTVIAEPVDQEKAAIMEAIVDLTNEIIEIKNKLNGGM